MNDILHAIELDYNHPWPNEDDKTRIHRESILKKIKSLIKQIPENKEERILLDIFDGHVFWKGVRLWWCDLCDTASIGCNNPECHGSSCNCGGCEQCIPLHQEFHKSKTHVWDYLSKSEKDIYYKTKQLQKFIIESLGLGETEINWRRLYETGQLSQYDEELFAAELKDKNLWIPYKID